MKIRKTQRLNKLVAVISIFAFLSWVPTLVHSFPPLELPANKIQSDPSQGVGVGNPKIILVQHSLKGLEDLIKNFVVPDQVKKAAEKGRKGLAEILQNNDRLAIEFGFKSAAEAGVGNTQLGAGLPFVLLHFKELTEYKPGNNPMSLLSFGYKFLYPVLVGGEVRSSLTVSRIIDRSNPQKITWRTTQWGAPKIIQRLDEAQKKAVKDAVGKSQFVLLANGLNRYFLGNIDIVGRKIKLIPLIEEKKLGFNVGVPMDAESVFRKLLEVIPNVPEGTYPKGSGAG